MKLKTIIIMLLNLLIDPHPEKDESHAKTRGQ